MRANNADKMTVFRLIVLVVFIQMIASACGTVEVRDERRSIAIADGAVLYLPAAADITESFDAVQSIRAEYEDRSYAFEAHIEVRPGSITIVALGPLGGALFSISYDGSELLAQGRVEAQVVNAEYVLADVLLAHWNVSWLNDRLTGAVVATSGDGKQRFVTRDDDLVIGISYDSSNPWGGSATLTHIERQYSLQIRTAGYDAQ